MYRPAEDCDRQDEAVGCKLDTVAVDLNAEIGSQLRMMTSGMGQLKKDMMSAETAKQLHVDDKVEKLEKAVKANIDAKMEEVTAQMDAMQVEMASELVSLLAAVSNLQPKLAPAPAPQPEPEPDM